MINKVQSSPSFGSTNIKFLQSEINKPILNSFRKYLSPIEKEGLKFKVDYNDQDMFMNILGKDAKTDNQIGNILTKMFSNAKFTQNVK